MRNLSNLALTAGLYLSLNTIGCLNPSQHYDADIEGYHVIVNVYGSATQVVVTPNTGAPHSLEGIIGEDFKMVRFDGDTILDSCKDSGGNLSKKGICHWANVDSLMTLAEIVKQKSEESRKKKR